MGPQKETVIWIDGLDEERNLPEMILRMVGANGKHRRIPLDDFPRSIQCVYLSTLDVHFYIGRLRLGKNFVKSDAVHHYITVADEG